MRDVREVMRLPREGAVAMRKIARGTGMARSTAWDMVLRFERSDLSWLVPPEINYADLEMRLYGPAGVKPGCRKLP